MKRAYRSKILGDQRPVTRIGRTVEQARRAPLVDRPPWWLVVGFVLLAVGAALGLAVLGGVVMR